MFSIINDYKIAGISLFAPRSAPLCLLRPPSRRLIVASHRKAIRTANSASPRILSSYLLTNISD